MSTSAALVVACALDLLGRSASRMPPIEVLDSPPAGVARNVEGLADRANGTIYLIASAPLFQFAMSRHLPPVRAGECRELDALRVIASIIVHEEWHLRQGADERGAYYAQLTELNRLGLGPGTWATDRVTRAMQFVLTQHAVRRRSSSPLGASTRAIVQGDHRLARECVASVDVVGAGRCGPGDEFKP